MRASKQATPPPTKPKTKKATKAKPKVGKTLAEAFVEPEGRVDDRARIVPIGSIKLWAANPRLNDDAVPVVAGSIDEFDFNDPIIVCRQTGEIVAGNTRYKAAMKLGLKEVPIRYTDLTPERAYAYALAANRTGEIAKWDNGPLGSILAQIQKDNEPLIKTLGFNDAEVRKLITVAGHSRGLPGNPTTFSYQEQFAVVVTCKDEAHQRTTYERLRDEGFECKVVCV